MASTLKINNLDTASGSTITVAGGKTLTGLVNASSGFTPPAGHVVQVKSMSTNSDNSYTSSTYTDTVLTLSITPTSSSNKILVMMDAEITVQGDSNFNLRLMRDSTEIFLALAGAGNFGSNNQHGHGYSASYLDSPSTTSATTYKFQVRENSNGTIRITGESGGGTLTLMEITA